MITDLLPADAIEGAVDRAYPLVLADYRVFIRDGMQDLALLRKMKIEKATAGDSREAKEDADYVTDRESVESAESEGPEYGSDQCCAR